MPSSPEGALVVPETFYNTQRAELHRPGERIIKQFPSPPEEGFKYEIQEVVRCLQNGDQESHIMPLDETLAIMQTLDRIREQLGLHYANDNIKREA